MKGKRYIFAKQFVGLPKPTDFELVEEELPPVKDGEVLFEALYLSVDPYMRAFAPMVTPGDTMFGTQVAKVLESKNKDYKVGDIVVGCLNWCTHSVVDPETVRAPYGEKDKPFVLPNFGDVPLSHALGALGMPGCTAYFGLTKICDPKPGETLVVTGAAGAVGSLVGQIGKIMGCKVIGFAGTDEKVNWLLNDLKFDAAYNYKTADIPKALKEAAPNGVDCYFDNVGGVISSQIMSAMNKFGRVSVCGAISVYNETSPPLAPVLQLTIIINQLKVEGFIVSRWLPEWMSGVMQMLKYMEEKKLVCKETVYEGFEKMPEAFIGLFAGANTGKAVVKI